MTISLHAPRSAGQRLTLAVGVVALVAVSAEFAGLLVHEGVSLWYPPAAVSLVVMATLGPAWGVLVAAAGIAITLVHVDPGAPLPLVLGARCTSAAAYAMGAIALRRWGWGTDGIASLSRLWIVSAATPLLAAAGVTGSLVAAGVLDPAGATTTAVDVYLGDAAALFTTAPLLLGVLRPLHRRDRDARTWLAIAGAATAGAAAMLGVAGALPPVSVILLAIVPGTVARASGLQSAALIAGIGTIASTSLSLLPVGADGVRLAQATLIAVSLLIGALHASTVAVQRSRRRTQRREARYAAILDSLADGVMVLDGRGRIVQLNPAMTRLLELDSADLAGAPLAAAVTGATHEDGSAVDLAALGAHIADGRIEVDRAVVAIERLTGTRAWISVTTRSLPPADDDTDARLVLTARDVTARVVQDRAAEAEAFQMRHRAMHDSLTGLPNRATLIDRLAAARRSASERRTSTALLVIDLDGFKAVNDILGHDAGDEVLVQVGVRLRTQMRDTDLAARLGGDEFVLVCEELGPDTAEQEVARIVGRIDAALAEPIPTSAGPACVGGSIGVAIAGPDDELDLSLVTRADEAMLRTKRGRRTARGESPTGTHPSPAPTDPTPAAEVPRRRRGDGALRVFIVDDDPAMRLLAVRIIEASDADVEVVGEAEDGRAAIARIIAEQPDLVLCDVMMPTVSGPEVVTAVRAHLPGQAFAFWSAGAEHLLRGSGADADVPFVAKDRIEELPGLLLELRRDGAQAAG